MKLRNAILALCALAAAGSARAGTFVGTGGAINDQSTMTSSVTVTDNLIITGVNVTIFGLEHTYWGDLDIYLTRGSTEIQLTTDNGGSSDPNGNFTFDDSATWLATVDLATQVTGGTFRPEQSFSAFHGINALGSWVLRVTDDARVDTGRFASWSITVAGTPGPVPEASTWAMMLTGFGLMGAALRRRRKAGLRYAL